MEHVAYLSRKFVGERRLFQESAVLQRPFALLNDLFGLARHENEPHRRTQRRDSSLEFKTGHAGHHEIANHQMNLARMLPEDLNGFRPIYCRQYLVATSFERQAEQPPQCGFVLYDLYSRPPGLLYRARGDLVILAFSTAA